MTKLNTLKQVRIDLRRGGKLRFPRVRSEVHRPFRGPRERARTGGDASRCLRGVRRCGEAMLFCRVAVW